jgi:hypothetical protein
VKKVVPLETWDETCQAAWVELIKSLQRRHCSTIELQYLTRILPCAKKEGFVREGVLAESLV